MGLDFEKVKEICKMGQGEACCRYLTAGAGGFHCEKRTALGRILDARVAEGRMTARGDCCEGVGP